MVGSSPLRSSTCNAGAQKQDEVAKMMHQKSISQDRSADMRLCKHRRKGIHQFKLLLQLKLRLLHDVAALRYALCCWVSS